MKVSQTMKLGLVLGGIVLVAVVMNNYSSSKMFVGEGMEQLKGSLGVQGPLADGGPMGVSKHSAGGDAQPVESLKLVILHLKAHILKPPYHQVNYCLKVN